MATRQTRIFVNQEEPLQWAETIIGRVIKPLSIEFTDSLNSFWFSRYICQLDMHGEDRGDCDFELIPNNFKQPFPGFTQPGHRSIRFRFEVSDANQADFEARLQQLVTQHEYAVSDIRDYDQLADLGGNRFLGGDDRSPIKRIRRMRLVVHLLQGISALVVDALIGPDPEDHYHIEYNDELQQNPNGSTFESLHHLFCNISQVPVSVLINTGNQPNLLGTFWGQPRGQREMQLNGQLVNEVYLPY